MEYSRHYNMDSAERDNLIKSIGIGEVVFSTIEYDARRGRKFLYEITSTAMLIVKATDRENYIITQYPARPSRIIKLWKNPDPKILELSIKYSKTKLTY